MINYKMNTMPPAEIIPEITAEQAKAARAFHSSFPEYEKTPLVKADSLARLLSLDKVYVKDESYRFGLNAFKVLGASYAMGRYIGDKAGLSADELTLDSVKKCSETLGKIPFFAATDGNHGRAVAWTAEKLGQPAEIYMPIGSSKERLDNIKATGAYAEITDMNYDDAVRFAADRAAKNGGVIIQDTAWEGYTKIPRHIMEGYGVIVDEVLEDIEMPTHIFLQAGVGSFAAGVTGCIYDYCKKSGNRMPKIIVVESDKADCYYKSAVADDGKARFVGGEMRTLMAGLACGEPNTTAFELLKSRADCFVSCDDKISADGMRILSTFGITSGESGAVTCGLLTHICMEHSELRRLLSLDKSSRVLLISTEGNTDKERYRDIVWFGRSSL